MKHTCSTLLNKAFSSDPLAGRRDLANSKGGNHKSTGITSVAKKQSFVMDRTLEASTTTHHHEDNDDSIWHTRASTSSTAAGTSRGGDNRSPHKNMHNHDRFSYEYPINRVDGRNDSHLLPEDEDTVDMVSNLNKQMEALQEALDKSREEVATLRRSVSVREKEIERLGALTLNNTDNDRTNLDYINKTNSQIVAQLNGQIDFLTGQLAELENELRACNEKKRSNEDEVIVNRLKMKELADTNKRISGELREAESKLRSMQEIQRAETARGAAANEIAVTEVSNLKEKLRCMEDQVKSKEAALLKAIEERNRFGVMIQSIRADKEKFSDAIDTTQHDR